jgi:hypothetical protein
VHDKFRFLHTNTIERTWRTLKTQIRNYKPSPYQEEDLITDYLHAFTLRSLCRPSLTYPFFLRVLRFYYTSSL